MADHLAIAIERFAQVGEAFVRMCNDLNAEADARRAAVPFVRPFVRSCGDERRRIDVRRLMKSVSRGELDGSGEV